MKKENIAIENSTKDYNDNINKINDLKSMIEKEIIEIDKLYEKVKNETTQSFLKKHEKLTKEEYDLKDKLGNEVTKVKEQLEKYLSETNKLIKISEKINKGIKNLQKEELNMTKTLSYVSKINKNKTEMKVLFQELMKNLKISFKEEESNIQYEDYYFNGIQTPKDIEFKDISSTSFKIFWKIDDINLLNIDKKQIKFKVELRKENSNEKFTKIYEGSNNNCLAENLDKNTNYEIKICSIYNDIISNWTKLEKIKTKDFDSIILRESNRENEFLEKLCEWSGYKNMDLIFRGSRDGMTSNSFHDKCDNQGPTISLFKNNQGYIFGGFTFASWTKDGNYHSDSNSFLFTLTNSKGYSPTKFPISNSTYSVYHHSQHGPTFGGGHDIYIASDFKSSSCYSNFPSSYQDTIGYGKEIFNGYNIQINEIEVYKMSK